MRKTLTILAMASLLLAGAGLVSGCGSKKGAKAACAACAPGDACADCLVKAGKMQKKACPGCQAGACTKCAK